MKNIFLLLILVASFSVNSQEKDKILPKANEEFVAKNYSEAEANYRISQSKATNKTVASYNLGNSIYRQNQAGEAKYAYTKALEKAKTYTEKHLAYHNLGNSFMKEKIILKLLKPIKMPYETIQQTNKLVTIML